MSDNKTTNAVIIPKQYRPVVSYMKISMPYFGKTKAASVIGCSPTTITNRERRGIYPPPTASSYGYKRYSIRDIMMMMSISHGTVDLDKLVKFISEEKKYLKPSQINEIISESYNEFLKDRQKLVFKPASVRKKPAAKKKLPSYKQVTYSSPKYVSTPSVIQ